MATEATSSRGGIQRLVRLRLRLTIWYVATFGLIIVLLGAGLFAVISYQLSKQLDDSLKSATMELVRAARITEQEPGGPARVSEVVDELNVPGRVLYLLDTRGNPIDSGSVDSWIQSAAKEAGRIGQVTMQHDVPNDTTLRLHAMRFKASTGHQLIAVAVADQVELEDRYADLITAFAGIAFAALILVAGGGFVLVRKSTAPIERSIEFTRRFMADAAHELRTPITILRTRAEVALQQPREAPDYVSALRGVEAEARRLGGIVDSLLVLARADAGERQIDKERIFLDDVAVDVAGAAEIVARQKNVKVSVDEFEEAPVVGDSTLIRQLIMIVLDNAVKFTDAGGQVHVRVSMHEGAPTFSVEDTGMGIKQEELSRVFQRFFRGEAARSRTDGAGLGLSIASWIAREHGAEISLSSEPGKGTKVVIRFPRAIGTQVSS
ncbi:MAG TPA: HAMP domain-containing sensor histidine kinase [Gemmatimonadaceae bacterium]|nr:HAMP domain-containing sensor histidine kinase [Gemmatimonadaceae bacterium]